MSCVSRGERKAHGRGPRIADTDTNTDTDTDTDTQFRCHSMVGMMNHLHHLFFVFSSRFLFTHARGNHVAPSVTKPTVQFFVPFVHASYYHMRDPNDRCLSICKHKSNFSQKCCSVFNLALSVHERVFRSNYFTLLASLVIVIYRHFYGCLEKSRQSFASLLSPIILVSPCFS